MSVLWDGKGVTPASMSQISYQVPGGKAPEGENKLARIIGTPWSATGLYPGWQAGDKISIEDPRDPNPEPRELGRGPLPESMGRFAALQFTEPGVRMEYVVEGVKISEEVSSRMVDGQREIERRYHVEKNKNDLWLVLGRVDPSKTAQLKETGNTQKSGALVELTTEADGFAKVRVKQSGKPIEFLW